MYTYMPGPDKRQLKMAQTPRNVGRMVKHLGGLPKSERAAREPFELGHAAMTAFKWDEAIVHFRKAMNKAKGTQLVALLNLIGLCQYASDRPADALRDYEESARLAEEFGDKQGKAADLGNIGNIYSAKGEPDRALKYYEEALAIYRKTAYQPGVANQLGSIALIHS
ncbi:MAG: tetratricopeptide repeat protein, partial [candidate division WOR-3 bacterium]|nr:tetratricopeptide repeat protein [candidate division WOR-3 bacterium]